MHPRLYAIRPISGHLILLVTAEMLIRFFDNRDPRGWTDPTPICPAEWVS